MNILLEMCIVILKLLAVVGFFTGPQSEISPKADNGSIR